jgi:hypothetical protein
MLLLAAIRLLRAPAAAALAALVMAAVPGGAGRAGEKPGAAADPVVKHALLFVGCSVRKGEKVLKDANDKNTFWISTVKVYNHLLKLGFKPENIYVLYKDAKPDWEDPAVKDVKAAIAKEFRAGYSNLATKANLIAVEKVIERKLDANDLFLLYLTVHGKNGVLRNEQDKKFITGGEVTRMLADNPTGNNLIFVHSCYAGNFMRNVDASGTVIGASRVNEVAWGDRDFTFAELFFAALGAAASDGDGDGKVSHHEAYEVASARYLKLGTARMDYIKNRWGGKGVPASKARLLTFRTLYVDAATRVRELVVEEECDVPRPKNLVPGTFDDLFPSARRKMLIAVNDVGVCGYPLKRGELRFRPGEFAERRPGHGPRGFVEAKGLPPASLSWAKRALAVSGAGGKEVLCRLPAEITDPSGLGYDGKHFLLADRKARAVFALAVDLKAGSVKVVSRTPCAGDGVEAVTFHAGRMWTTDGKKLFAYGAGAARAAKVVAGFDLTVEVSGIAFAGKYLYASAKGRATIYCFPAPTVKR